MLFRARHDDSSLPRGAGPRALAAFGAAVLLAFICASGALGQGLSLDPVPTPSLGGPSAIEQIARQLGENNPFAAERARAAKSEFERLAAQATETWRELARRMLERSMKDDDDAAGAALVAGLTMNRAAARVDEIAESLARDTDAEHRQRAESALQGFLRATAHAEPASATSPDAIDLLLRDAAGEIAEAAALPPGPLLGGWPTSAGDPGAIDFEALERALADAEATGIVPIGGIKSAHELIPVLHSAAARAGFGGAAVEGARTMTGALSAAAEAQRASRRAGDSSSNAFLDPNSVRLLGEALADALARFSNKDARAGASEDLDSIGAAGELLAAIRELARPGMDLRSARRAAADAVVRITGPDARAGAFGARAARRVLDMARERRLLPRRAGAEGVPHDLSRAWAKMEQEYTEAERRAMESMEPFVRDPGLVRRPEGASMLSRQRSTLDAFRNLLDLRAFVERRTESKVAPRAGAGGRAALRRAFDALLKQLESTEERGAALTELARRARLARLYEALPGESLLRAGDPAMAKVFVDRADEVAREIGAARDEWLRAWAGAKDPAPGDERRLELWRRIMVIARLHAELSRPGALERSRSWGALEFPAAAAGRLVGSIPELLREPTTLLLAGKMDLAADALNFAERRTRAARVLADVARRMPGAPRAASDNGAAAPAPLDPVLELATPPTGGAARERGTLAAISRWLFELEAAMGRGEESAETRAIEEYLNDLASRVAPGRPDDAGDEGAE